MRVHGSAPEPAGPWVKPAHLRIAHMYQPSCMHEVWFPHVWSRPGKRAAAYPAGVLVVQHTRKALAAFIIEGRHGVVVRKQPLLAEC